MAADGVGQISRSPEEPNEASLHTIAEAASPMIGTAPARGETVTFLKKLDS